VRIPREDLKEFIYYDVVKDRPDLPERKVQHPTGENEVLKPLAVWDGPAVNKPERRSFFFRFSDYQRPLMLAAAFAVVALAVGVGIDTWMSTPLAELATPVEIAADEQSDDLTPSDTSADESDLMSSEDSPSAFNTSDTDEPAPARAVTRHRRKFTSRKFGRLSYSSPTVRFAAVRVKPRPLIHPQFIVSEFVPTTLIIYVDNGVVRSRIEPQLAAYKRSVAIPNE
jgi:hypothetical protein